MLPQNIGIQPTSMEDLKGLEFDTHYTYYTWLVVWNIFYFSHILGIIIPSDFHIFQRGSNHQPDTIMV